VGDNIDLYSTRARGGGSNGDDPGRFFVCVSSPLDCVSLDVCELLIGKVTERELVLNLGRIMGHFFKLLW
jgi:hypothetical protein